MCELFIHRQTLANAMRFTTAELAELEARIAHAADRALAIELDDLRAADRSGAGARRGRCAAAERRACRARRHAGARRARRCTRTMCGPRSTRRLAFAIEGGRHPVVEQTLRRSDGASFVGNDCDARRRRGAALWLVTGPEHGRQIDLPAAERADRHAGADRARSCRREAPISASSTACSAASAPPTTSPAAARPSWSRWSRPPRSSTRRPSARSSSSTRSAAAPRPSTACRSPGRRSSICTTTTAAARCSPPTTMS